MDSGKSRRRSKNIANGSREMTSNPVTVRFVNVLVVCAVLLFAIELSDGSFTSRINKISDHLNKALDEALFVGNVTYTDLYVNSTYYSKTEFKARGMADLYHITQTFIGWVVNKDIYPEGFISVKNGNIMMTSPIEQWQNLLMHYAGVLTVVIILLLLAVFMPLCGFFFCCCRCCGNCGARSKPFDKKGDLCKKVVYALLLIVVGTLLIFGVVCAFVSNQYMQNGTNDLTNNLRTGVNDTDTYIKATNKQIKTLLNVNYNEFKSVLFNTLDRCSDIVLEQLSEYSNATALTEVVNIVNGLDNIKENLTFMKTVTRELQVNASQLNDGLRAVKRSLLQTLMNCSQRIHECNELSNNVSRLSTEIDFNSLPDISSQLEELNRVLEANITSTVVKGQQAFESIRIEINNTISSHLPQVKASIEDAGSAISKGASNITDTLESISNKLNENTAQPLNRLEWYIKEFTPIRYYIGLGASGMLLLVTLFVALGLICGICGKRPDAYSDDCCNKGAGSRFLMTHVCYPRPLVVGEREVNLNIALNPFIYCETPNQMIWTSTVSIHKSSIFFEVLVPTFPSACVNPLILNNSNQKSFPRPQPSTLTVILSFKAVGIMFLFTLVLALITIIYFLTGILAQRMVCDSLRKPRESKIVSLLDDFLQYQFNTSNLKIDVANIIESCHKNHTVYNVLGLKSVFNVDDVTNYLDKFSINETLSELTSKIQANTSVVIFDAAAQQQLTQLVESGIANIGYDKFIDELKIAQNLTSISLNFLIEKLEEVVKQVENNLADSHGIATSLRLSTFHLYTYQTMLVEPMTAKSKQMITVAENLKESLKFGKSSFEQAIQDLITELLEAQEYLQTQGTTTLHEIAVNFITSIEKQVRSYLDRVVTNTVDTVGECYPASLVLNSTLVATCDKILLPLNGHWFSILWSLIVFIPTIILSIKLATLYQKYEPYPGALVESEYLHDVYTDRDNIPLHSPSGKYAKKKQKKKSKRLDGRGTYVAEGTERAVPVASGSAYPEARYADMAPKHWEDFPNGGPPQYQRAPTEYERPPPYYFPGTDQQQ